MFRPQRRYQHLNRRRAINAVLTALVVPGRANSVPEPAPVSSAMQRPSPPVPHDRSLIREAPNCRGRQALARPLCSLLLVQPASTTPATPTEKYSTGRARHKKFGMI